MSIALLDVNFLIALLTPTHVHHDSAQRWLSLNRKKGWATCPTTVNGCIRILSNPRYFKPQQSASEIADALREACAASDHRFWPDSVSLLDASLFRTFQIVGHQQLTDIYLLGLAVRNHGCLATFDRSITLKAVAGATPANLALI